jgi:hypothetical protein
MQNGQIACPENAWINTLEANQTEAIALAKEIISEQIYCTLSTCSVDGMPWGSPLLFVYDEAFNFYWSSAIAAQHSQNIYQNQGKSVLTIYDAAKIKAVYLSGIATELTEQNQLEKVLQLFDLRAKRPTPRMVIDYLNESPRRMYQFVIKASWITGDRLMFQNQLMDTKIAIHLDLNW